MQHCELVHRASRRRLSRFSCVLVSALFTTWIAGCGGGTNSSNTVAPQQGPQTYMTPEQGTARLIPAYTIDDTANPKTFSMSTFTLSPPGQEGLQIIDSGVVTANQRNLLSLGITTSYALNSNTTCLCLQTMIRRKQEVLLLSLQAKLAA